MSFYRFLFSILVSIVDYPNKKKIFAYFKKKLTNKKIILFDIGAHKGETIKFFNKNFYISKIFAFEPNRQLFKNLKNKFYKVKKIKFYNYGVGNKNTKQMFYIYNDTASSSFKKIDKSTNYFLRKKKITFDNYIPKAIKTNVVTLDSFIYFEKFNQVIDILKIDTEGFEYNVLKGISQKNFKKIKFIYFEHHYDKMILKDYTFSDINNVLIKNNFVLAKKIKMSFRKSFEYIYLNKSIS